MNFSPFPSSLLLLLLCFTCGPAPEPTPPPLSSAARSAQQRLGRIGMAIDDYRLPEALADARALRPWVEDRRDSVPDTLRVRLYQYLSELHSKRWMWFDSITYYTEKAEALLPADAAPELRVRQLYVKALGRSNYDRSWVDIMMTADLGLALLEEAGREGGMLYAKLLEVKGVALKKHGDLLADRSRRAAAHAQGEATLRGAVRRFSTLSRSWERAARTQLALLLIRLRDREAEWRLQVDTIVGLEPAGGAIDSLFINGFYHSAAQRDHPGTARQYFEPLVSRGPFYNYRYDGESYYYLALAAMEQGDYATALEASAQDSKLYGCCVDEHPGGGGDTASACRQYVGCAFYLIEHVRLLLAKYEATSTVDDLRLAYRMSQRALAQYEEVFNSYHQESILNILRDSGTRMLNISLEAAARTALREPTPAHLNTLFQTMERGKSLLLRDDLLRLRSVDEGLIPGKLADSIAALNAALLALTSEYEAQASYHSTSVQYLTRYQEVEASFQEARRRAHAQFGEHPDAVHTLLTSGQRPPDLADIRRGLGSSTALIEHAQTDDHVYVLYADRDTALVYALDLDQTANFSARLTASLTSTRRPSPPEREAFAVLASTAYAALLGPVERLLEHRRRIVLVPCAATTSIPFTALVAGRTADGRERYVLDRFTLRYLSSYQASMITAQRASYRDRLTDRPRVAVLTHPDLRAYFSGLQQQLARTTDETSLSHSSALAGLGKVDWLHLSIHARAESKNIYSNYLYFAPDDSLSSLQLSRQRLPISLVVLAACSGNSGFTAPGEGTLSIRRSFEAAGVTNVISSLYEVAAPATSILLSEMYTSLLEGASPPEALHHAQLAMRTGKLGQRYTWPGCWAGVVAN